MRPGTETALALAIANVVAADRGAPAAVAAALAGYTPAMAAQETGIPAERIERMAREFAAARAEPGGGGRHRRAARGRGPALRRGQPAQLRRRQRRPDGQVRRRARRAATATRALAQLVAAMDGGQVAVLLVHDANPVYALPKAAGFAEQARRRCRSRCRTVALPRRDRRAVRPAAARSTMRSSAGTTRRRGPGVRSLMQPVMEPVFNTRAAGDVLLQVSPRRRAARWRSSPRRPGRPTFAAAGRRWPPSGRKPTRTTSGARRCSAAACSTSRAAPPPWRSLPSATDVAYSRPAFEGNGEFVFAGLSARAPARRPRRQQALAARERRPRHQDHLAFVGGGESRNGPARSTSATARSCGSRRRTARSRLPAYIYLGLHPDVIAMPLGLGHTELRRLRAGAAARTRSTCSARRPAISFRMSPPGCRRTRPAAIASSRASRAVPASSAAASRRPCRWPLAKKGLTLEEAYSRRAPREHDVNTPLEVAALKGWSEAQCTRPPSRRLRQRPPAVGHVDRPVALHRLSGVRDRLLRREQHPHDRRDRRCCAAAK